MKNIRPFNLICMVGMGYIGLPTAAVIANTGSKVLGVDVNSKVVETINEGKTHIFEPGLTEIVNKTVKSGCFRATNKPETADAYLIAVPTPLTDEYTADLSYVFSAGKSIAPVLKTGDLIILESTSPVGTTERLIDLLATLRQDLRFPRRGQEQLLEDIDVNIAYCPERVLPGKVIKELVSNDRPIGGITQYCTNRAIELYSLFVEGELLPTDTRSAELCKLAENAFRDVNIAYANELANICDSLSMNVWEVIRLANRHPRVNILEPGPGVGGHCIALDPWFIVQTASEETQMIQSARAINLGRPQRVLDQIEKLVIKFLRNNPGRNKNSVTIACYGLSFKPNIDDLRESPALQITKKLSEEHQGIVWAVEPNISNLPSNLTNINLVDYQYAKQKADIHVLLVGHHQFVASGPKSSYVVDVKGLWIPEL